MLMVVMTGLIALGLSACDTILPTGGPSEEEGAGQAPGQPQAGPGGAAQPDEPGDGDGRESPGTGEPDADVLHVRAIEEEDGEWTFEVRVQHPDTGWDDYADGWDVVGPDGSIYKASSGDTFTRELAHPHVDEQPFTRRQTDIEIPEGMTTVTVRAHDTVDGFGGRTVVVDLTNPTGDGYEVIRD